MLYVSTRNKTDSFTAYRALHADKTPDGGLFVPFHLPAFSTGEIHALKDKTFSETVANVLNLFFSRGLTSWDVEFSVGRCPFKFENIGQQVTVVELWHNSQSNSQYLVANLYKKLSDKIGNDVPLWAGIAIEIALLFGLFGEMLHSGMESADLAVMDNDFRYSVAAWYARKMGLPIRLILCGCTEDSGLWDFLRKGEVSANIPEEVERLIYENFGADKAKQFVAARESGRIFRLDELQRGELSQGIYPFVIGPDRISSVKANMQSTFGYITDPYTAAAYAALQDYRAATGEKRTTVILSRCSSKE